MDRFKISTFNCKNFNGDLTIKLVSELFEKCDILCIEEHHKYETEFDKFDDLLTDKTVMKEGTSAMDPTVIIRGRKHGGTMILWKGNIQSKIVPIGTVSKRLSCIEIMLDDNVELLLFCVYMPCDEQSVGDNLDIYQEVLTEISLICQTKDASNICLAGDLNTDLCRNSPQTRELLQFCDNENLVPLVKNALSNIVYTYEHKGTGSRSLIDHIIVSKNLEQFLHQYYTVDSIDNTSDHLPVVAEFNFNCKYLATERAKSEKRVAWYKASLGDIKKYKNCLDCYLDCIEVGHVVECKNINCNDKTHIAQIQTLHNDIIDACLQAAWTSVPSGGGHGDSSTSQRKSMPGFSEYVKEKRDVSLYWHWLWKEMGKPRHGFYADRMRTTRAHYHYAVRMVQRYESSIRSDKMAESIADGNYRNLWREAKRSKGKGNRIPKTVDGVSGKEGISQLFAKKFSTLYNSVGFNQNEMNDIKREVKGKLDCKDSVFVEESMFKVHDLIEAFKYVKCNKSDGYLGLFSDHILNGTSKLYDMLVKLFNCILIHGCCPNDMLTGTLIPIPKNSRASISSSDNFRAICLQSVLCKLMDIVILYKESGTLITSELQFGFKKGLSAGLATSVFLETTEYYVRKGGTVYALALDASKAFDRVQYDRLFRLLSDRNVNPLYIRLLMSMYVSQRLRVLFDGESSDWFCVTNGVKQGGVLSPTLFGIYVDGLLTKLKALGIGCHIGDVYCGSLGYADDLELLVPTINALKRMIKVCEDYAASFNIIFNGSKSLLMIFGEYQDCEIYVCGERVNIVKKMKHLGHVITDDINDSLTQPIVNDFNVKFNTFLAYFKDIRCDVKNTLFKQYCSSFYGSHIAALYHRDINNLHVAWRKAIRRVWQLPDQAHCVLLPHISGLFPSKVMFCKRFLKHFLSGFNNQNEVVKTVFRSSMLNLSRLGKNFRHVCFEYDIDVWNTDFNSMNASRCTVGKWEANVIDENVRVGMQIKELCVMRGSMNEWLLDKSEMSDIIDHLCTT